MDPSSFTIEFHEHVPYEKVRYCIGHLSDAGAAVVAQDDPIFLLVCLKPEQVAHVGWALFHTHFSGLCQVIETSGAAENRASAYPRPSPR